MLKNRIREFRLKAGLSQESLGEKVLPPAGGSTIDKVEKGKIGLTFEWVERIADALGVDPLLLVNDRPLEVAIGDLGSDAEQYTPKPGSDLAALASAGRQLWRVKRNVLDEFGITAGALLLVDTTQETVSQVETADMVLVRYLDPRCGNEVMLLREFIEPSLLVTNSMRDNTIPLNLKADQVQVVARILHHIRHLRPAH